MPAYFDADNELDARMGPHEEQAEHCCTPSDPCSTHAEIYDCSCVEFCDESPRTACSLSGVRHVHPTSQGEGFGPCPVHPDAPGDL